MNTTPKQIELFLKSSHFDRGLRLGVAIAIPFGICYFAGQLSLAPAIVLGAFLNAAGDVPGSIKRKIITILVSIGVTMVVTAIVLFAKPYLSLTLLALSLISFLVSFIAVYGFRASLVSFSGLLAMVIAFAVEKETPKEIGIQVGLMAVGGIWYLLVSYAFRKLAPKKDHNQLLSDSLSVIGEYLQLRAKLLTERENRDELLKEMLGLQHQINEKHETLREILLTERKRSGKSGSNQKHLLLFLSSVNIFELIEAERLDYDKLDRIFKEHPHFMEAPKQVNTQFGEHLMRLADVLIQKDPLPKADSLKEVLSKVEDAISEYLDTLSLPKAREGGLILKNLHDYQEQLLQEINAIRRVMSNVKEAEKVSLKQKDKSKFLTLQEYKLGVLLQHFSIDDKMFRHALRFTIAILIAYGIGYYFDIQNTYWILLTIVVIMRPSYGLTKDRSKDRIIGTLIGAAIAVGIVLLTKNEIVYGAVAFISLILAFALLQQNYKSAAALITLSIIFVYSFINPDAFEVIQYRVLDTIIGGVIAVVSNYIILPSWEVNNLTDVLKKALDANRSYLLTTRDFYEDPSANKTGYNVARKEAFLAIGNLNAAFQRMTQDPESKQKEYQLIYELVTLNHTILSAIASIGNFVMKHTTTPASDEFNALVQQIATTLEQAQHCLQDDSVTKEVDKISAEEAEKALQQRYQELAASRDKSIKQGNAQLDTETLHGLQEAYLISTHMSWLNSLSKNLNKATKKYAEAIV
ncbi:YccS family putative transporter [Gangjinia marincola]|uniref:YccS family putative transporter n=1 Tax=Gangjinia marincola TaxID=578463 RepID=A0ABN1MFA2_9FLAO